jgi:hypothetical protein
MFYTCYLLIQHFRSPNAVAKEGPEGWLRMAMLIQGNNQESTQMEHVEGGSVWLLGPKQYECMVDIAWWKTKAKSVHGWVS